MFAAVAMAILVGMLTPLLTLLQVSFLLPMVLLGGAFMVFLYCFAGRMPAMLFMAAQLSSTAAFLNVTFMAMMLAAGSIPAIIVMRGIAYKKPFFEQMRTGIAAYVVGMLAAVVIAFMAYGGNMVGKLIASIREQLRAMPDEMFAPYVDWINAAIGTSGVPGISTMTVEGFRERVMDGTLSMMGEAFERFVPETLMTGALLNGVISVTWGNWLLSRHGLTTDESYVGLKQWFLPAQATLGLLLIWAISMILSEAEFNGGDKAFIAISGMLGVALTIQALAAVNRFFYKRGMGSRRRHWIIALVFIAGELFEAAGLAVAGIGAVSALFGSNGAVRQIRRQREKQQDRHDDPNDSER